MSESKRNETFADAYTSSIRALLHSGSLVEPIQDVMSPGSRFGAAPRSTLELMPYTLTFNDARSCLFLDTVKRIRLPYCYGLLLWTLNGSCDVKSLTYYHGGAPQFADSPERMSGAFGNRMLVAKGDQLSRVIARLRSDRTSRRTVCLIALPDDNLRSSREYPCAISVQYMIRNEFLCSLSCMRSQSALMVLPYDVFLFCGLQLFVAATLGIPPGAYFHTCASFHVYEDELDLARKLLCSPTSAVAVAPMAGGKRLEELKSQERELRHAHEIGDSEFIKQSIRHTKRPTSFEDEAQLVLAAYAAEKSGLADESFEAVMRLEGSLQQLAAANFNGVPND
jgi:thymidylate synthase